jgi:hypothetical protein
MHTKVSRNDTEAPCTNTRRFLELSAKITRKPVSCLTRDISKGILQHKSHCKAGENMGSAVLYSIVDGGLPKLDQSLWVGNLCSMY